MIVYHLPQSFENFGFGYFGVPDLEIFRYFQNILKVVQNFQPEFPKGRCVYHLGFSPVPSSTLILMRVTFHLVGVVQMVRTNPDRNFSLGIFAYHFYKPVFPSKWQTSYENKIFVSRHVN